MSLPKLKFPTFIDTIPSTKKQIKFRPYTTVEEKILLTAAAEDTTEAFLSAIQQILTNCLIGEVDVLELTSYDVEYLLLRLRAKSVDNISKFKLKDPDDGEYYEVEVDLDQVEVNFTPEHHYHVVADENTTLVLKDPSHAVAASATDDTSILIAVINQVVGVDETGEDIVAKFSEHTREEQEEFINQFSSHTLVDIRTFFETMPAVKINVSYQKNDGTTGVQEVVGIQSFFE